MLNNISIGSYYLVDSKIHKMNSICKVISILLFIIMTLSTNNLILLLFLLLVILYIVDKSNIPVSFYLRTVKSMKMFLIFIFIINIILKMSLITNGIMILRVVMITIYSSVLTYTTPPTEITYALEKIFRPLKTIRLPISQLAFTMTFALRFIPMIIEQGNKILKSQASRGVDYHNSNLKGKFLALKAMIIPMFILTIKRADSLADAMEVRQYNINKKRTNYRMNRWTQFETKTIIIHLFILILIVIKG